MRLDSFKGIFCGAFCSSCSCLREVSIHAKVVLEMDISAVPASQGNGKHKIGIRVRQDGTPQGGSAPMLVFRHRNLAMKHPVWFTLKSK